MRYTEARFSRIAVEMLRDIDANTVDWVPNYDETRREPTVLPSRVPNLMVNGSSGIAVGMATNIPPHNLGEVVDAIVHAHRQPRRVGRRPHAAHQGARLSHRRRHPRHRRHQGGLPHRARPHPRPRQGPHRADQGQPHRHHRHRAALSGQPRRAHREHRRSGQGQEDHRDLRPAQRIRPLRHAPRHRAQARRHRPWSCSTSSTSTPRCRPPSASSTSPWWAACRARSRCPR